MDVKTLGSALRRAEDFGFIDKNPVPAAKLPKAVSTDREAFTLAETGYFKASAFIAAVCGSE